MGRLLSQTSCLSDANGDPMTQDVTTNTWDGVGNELTSSSTTMGGQPAAWTYDDVGDATSSWTDGVYSDTSGTRDSGHLRRRGPDPQARPAGKLKRHDLQLQPRRQGRPAEQPRRQLRRLQLRANGNKLSQTVPMSGYSPNNANVATTNYTYDYANRLTSTTEPNSFATTYGYDELWSPDRRPGLGNASATNTILQQPGLGPAEGRRGRRHRLQDLRHPRQRHLGDDWHKDDDLDLQRRQPAGDPDRRRLQQADQHDRRLRQHHRGQAHQLGRQRSSKTSRRPSTHSVVPSSQTDTVTGLSTAGPTR